MLALGSPHGGSSRTLSRNTNRYKQKGPKGPFFVVYSFHSSGFHHPPAARQRNRFHLLMPSFFTFNRALPLFGNIHLRQRGFCFIV